MALTWLFPDEVTAATDTVMDRLDAEVGVVPGLWFVELANTAVIAERKGRISQVETDQFLRRLDRAAIEDDREVPGRIFRDVLPLCRHYRLTSYDAVYIELALRRGLPLATLDVAMGAAARELGLQLLV